MSQIAPEGKHQIHSPLPLYPTSVYQQSSHNHYFGSFQEGHLNSQHGGKQNQPSVGMNCTQAPQAPSNTFSHYGMTEGMLRYYMSYLPGSAVNMPAYQLHNSSSSLSQGEAGTSTHSSQKPAEDALQKREIRLMKNREAARECRRKKKEYVSCLEYRVAVLEKQNRTLIEELRALKDVYRHKVVSELPRQMHQPKQEPCFRWRLIPMSALLNKRTKEMQEEAEGTNERPSGLQPRDGIIEMENE